MEVLIIGIVAVAAIGYWIWVESKNSKTTVKSVSAETVVAPILTETVTTPTADIAADRAVETETVASPKKAKKPAPKAVAKPKKAAPKKQPAAKITAKTKTTKK